MLFPISSSPMSQISICEALWSPFLWSCHWLISLTSTVIPSFTMSRSLVDMTFTLLCLDLCLAFSLCLFLMYFCCNSSYSFMGTVFMLSLLLVSLHAYLLLLLFLLVSSFERSRRSRQQECLHSKEEEAETPTCRRSLLVLFSSFFLFFFYFPSSLNQTSLPLSTVSTELSLRLPPFPLSVLSIHSLTFLSFSELPILLWHLGWSNDNERGRQASGQKRFDKGEVSISTREAKRERKASWIHKCIWDRCNERKKRMGQRN